jgi:NTP pyrophosphatase (non-canonical NTP hydrolase)
MTQLEELTNLLFDFLRERGWDKVQPGPLAKSIAIEAAELLEHFQWTEYSKEQIQANPEKLERVQSEIADILIYSLQLCGFLELDPEKIIRSKLKKVAQKYPADEVRGSEEAYWRLKMQGRKNNLD